MLRPAETELADQRLPALPHRTSHQPENPLVGERLGDGDIPFEMSQIGRRAVSRVQREELAFDVRLQLVGQVHSRQLRRFAHPRAPLNVPFVKRLGGHVQRFGKGDGRHDAVDRTVGESDRALRPCGRRRIQRLVYGRFEARGRTHAVLAGDDVERRSDSGRFTRPQSCGDDRCDPRQDTQPDGRRHQIGVDQPPYRLPAVRPHGRHAGDPQLGADFVRHMDRIAPPPVDLVHQLRIRLRETDLVSGLRQQGADKTAADLAGPEMNGSLHDRRSFPTVASPYRTPPSRNGAEDCIFRKE